MAKLSDLLSSREITANVTNLEKGKVYSVSNGDQYVCILEDTGWCWQSPGCGIATIEVWGAAGSGSRQCCCSTGLPGNAPAYSRKVIAVWPCTSVTATVGMSCNAHSLCVSGRSQSSCVTWEGARDLCGNTSGCICAQGGHSGMALCHCNQVPYCCYVAFGMCHTLIGTGCGIICNLCSPFTNDFGIACGFGGDTNCCGCVSRVEFRGCQTACVCRQVRWVPYAAGIFSEMGGWLVGPGEEDSPEANWSGAGLHPWAGLLEFTKPGPTGGQLWGNVCWQSRQCGCWDYLGCNYVMPYGVAGPAPQPCAEVRDHGYRGGPGAVRITYRGTDPNVKYCISLGGAF